MQLILKLAGSLFSQNEYVNAKNRPAQLEQKNPFR